MLIEGWLAILGLQVVDMNGSIGGLGSHKLVQWIPGYPLYIVVVLRDLPNHLSWKS